MRARGALGATVVVVALAVLAPPALAARLPDWAAPIASAAPSIDAGVSDVPARVLFSETRVTVLEDGSVRTRRRFATQALSARAEEVGLGFFAFEDGAKVKVSKAWHVPPGEKAEKSHDAPVDVTLSDEFLTASRTRVVKVAGIKRGSLVFFEFEAVDTPVALVFRSLFYEAAPVAIDRFELATPAGWPVRYGWMRRKGPEPTRGDNVLTWEMRDLPGPVDEPLGTPVLDEAPLLWVGVAPAAGAQVRTPSMQDWAAVSMWYAELAKGRDEVTPAIAAAARGVYEKAGPGFLDRVGAAATYVRDHVRYVAREVAIGGYQPHPAAQVLGDLAGDCKDKGTLFRAMLAAGGQISYPILINATSAATVSDEVPTPGAFDHLVVGIPVPDGTSVPEGVGPAIVDAGDLGRLLVVDATDEYESVGSLSVALAGKKGLVLASDKGRLVDFPSASASAHRIETRLNIEILPDKSVSFARTCRYFGEPAAVARRDYRQSSLERRKKVQREITAEWPGGSTETYSVEVEGADGSFLEAVSWKVPPPAPGDAALVPLFPGALDELPRVPLTRRKTPVQYDFPRTLRFETHLTGASEASLRPASEEQKGAGWTVTSHCERKSDAIEGTWELVLSRSRYDPDAFPELKQLWAASGKAASPAVPLTP